MDGLYQWVGSLVSYLVFVTVLTALLPSVRYERYLRLFAGCVLILLVFQPFTVSFRLESVLDQLFRSVSVQEEAYGLISQKDPDLEARKLELLFSEYEKETEKELVKLAEQAGFFHCRAKVRVERREEQPDFAKIKEVSLSLHLPQQEAAFCLVEPIEVVEVKAEVAQTENRRGEKEEAEDEPVTDVRVSQLRQQIAAEYQMEEAYVEIRLEAR